MTSVMLIRKGTTKRHRAKSGETNSDTKNRTTRQILNIDMDSINGTVIRI